MNADFQLAREGAFGDLAIHGGAGQPSASQYGFKADNSFEFGHGMFFHSLAVVGTPLDRTLALKISYARAFWVLVKAGAHSAALGRERLRTVRNEYGRVWTEGLGEPWRIKKYRRADHSLAIDDKCGRRWRNSGRQRTEHATNSEIADGLLVTTERFAAVKSNGKS